MKKILCAVLALAAMASCSKEYIVAENKQAIGFGEAFVDNGTRADYSTDKTVSQFLVYGTVQGKYAENAPIAYIFDGDEVSNKKNGVTVGYGDVWFCDNTQYWVPNAKYNFTAVVDGALTNNHTQIEFTVADGEGNLDLLYATAEASVDNNGKVTGTGLTADNGLVKFQFAHLLSKLQFAAPTHVFGSGYTVKVTEIKVANVVDKGVYTVDGGTWARDTNATENGIELDFCDAVDTFKSRQILPLNQALTVTINYEVHFGTTKISEVTKTGTIPAQDYDKGFVYVITPNITANQIKFTVTGVDGWDDDIDNDGDSDTGITL